MGVEPAVPKPKEPAPPRPQRADIEKLPTTVPLPQGEVVVPPVKVEPLPLPPIPEPEPTVPMMTVPFYGTSCGMHADVEALGFTLSSIDEKSIAATWKQLSLEKYDGLLHDCMTQREALHLSDWGYLSLVGHACEQLLGKGSNEAVLLQMYLLAQSGYRVRMARADKRLVLLVPFNRSIYNYAYVNIDGMAHYVISLERSGMLIACSRCGTVLFYRLPSRQEAKARGACDDGYGGVAGGGHLAAGHWRYRCRPSSAKRGADDET